MKIEKILDKIADKSHPAVIVVMKANKGYSVIPIDKEFYAEHFILKEHYNGPSVIAACKELLNAGRRKVINILRSPV